MRGISESNIGIALDRNRMSSMGSTTNKESNGIDNIQREEKLKNLKKIPLENTVSGTNTVANWHAIDRWML